ncbi:aldose epimerase family protein [Thalassotalea sp. G2M2-11]|uniref:aldose epimerase family protein n=1 Tax=Thalassotalea sp. G2M2-11 TaxID=2787627 RepID=UPI0019D2484E|nr:aldose epimerase family protein [Thalassotalea sp. G2M2-11]
MTTSHRLTLSKKQLVDCALAAPLEIITLTNCHGLSVSLSNLGASIWSVTVPEKNDKQVTTELVLNYQNVADWANNPYYFGVTAGRVANRIGNACFELNGKTINLTANEGVNQLHGGPGGLSQCFWSSETHQEQDAVVVVYRYHSPDGDQGFPGNMDIEVTYRLNNDNELTLSYQAVADQTTPICLTNHAYWNIAGTSSEDVLAQTLELSADHVLALNEQQIPTGELISVTDTAFDFRQRKAVGQDIQQLANGYDHYFVVNRDSDELMPVAKLMDPKSGRVMEILSTELGVQFYSGNFLDGSHTGSDGKPLTKFKGLCLETHGYPDAVNHSLFPSVIVKAGDVYRQTTQYRFCHV